MKRMQGWAISSLAVIACLVVACGGRVGAGEGGGQPDAGSTTAEAGHSSSDAGPGSLEAGSTLDSGVTTSGDAGICVNIDPSTYDTSCGTDSDCIDVAGGDTCSGYNCLCGGTAINADGQSRYDAALASVPQGSGPFCNCPYFGRPRCLQSQCVFCPSSAGPQPAPEGCPDGG